MKEKSANSNLRDGIVRVRDRWSRVENVLEPGMPDINACLAGKEVWIETKLPIEPRRATTPLFGSNHDFGPAQRNWALAQLNAGGMVLAYVETAKRRMILHGKHIANGEINSMTLNAMIQESLWHATKPTKKEEWDHARAIIISL